jgi:hypothetical protein
MLMVSFHDASNIVSLRMQAFAEIWISCYTNLTTDSATQFLQVLNLFFCMDVIFPSHTSLKFALSGYRLE